MEKITQNIPIIRHLDEADDLSEDFRDGELLPDQDEKALAIAQRVLGELLNTNKKAVLFVTSPRKRATATAELVGQKLKDIDNSLKIRISINDNLVAIKEGRFILPEDYEAGDYFIGLEFGAKAFGAEVHASDNGVSPDNYLYRFGDPLMQPDGMYKYPELAEYFASPGENYREVLIRLYTLVIQTARNINKFTGDVCVSILTHGQPAQVFKDLNSVATKHRLNRENVETGTLPRLCWEEYKSRDKNERITGQTDFISIENLLHEGFIEILENEIEYLHHLA
jgi:broad specificity phosphatase PhoE